MPSARRCATAARRWRCWGWARWAWRPRIDTWSDLDFFAIVEPGSKARYLHRLDWLAAARPLAWHFQNTVDGHKALMDDGVFCEFAVFEPQELDGIPFAPGRVVWKRDDVDASMAHPRKPLPSTARPTKPGSWARR
jgi:hypothetical protein